MLRFESEDPGVAAQLTLSNGHKHSTIDVPLRSRGDYLSRWLEAIWRLPRPDAHLDATIYNHSRKATRVVISLSDNRGAALDRQEFVLDAYQSREIDFKRLAAAGAGSLGGISVEHFGRVGTVVVSGSVTTPSDGRSSGLTFIDVARIRSEKWYGAGVQLGDTQLGDGFSGNLFLRNISTQPIEAAPRLQCGMNKTSFETIALPPGASTVKGFAAEAIACADQGITLEVETTAKGAVIAQWMSTDGSGELVVHTPLHSVSPKANLSGTDPFRISENTASVLYVTNTGDKDAAVMPLIHPGGTGHPASHGGQLYVVGQTTIRPGETITVDIRTLRDEKKPDVNGFVLPADMSNGQIHWLRREGPAMVANLISVSAGQKSSASYSFFCCFCSPNSIELSLDPGSAQIPWGGSVGFKAFQQVYNCHPWSPPQQIYDVNWSSSNPFVAAVNSVGDVVGVGPGSAYIAISKTVVLYESFEIGTECESGPCEPPEEGCASFEVGVGASAPVDVLPPPPPPPPPPTISGGDTVWFFQGQNPTGYTTVVTLTASPAASGPYTWTVVAGANMIHLTNFVANQVDILASGSEFSQTLEDVSIKVRVNNQDSAAFKMTVRTPHKLTSGSILDQPDSEFGYFSLLKYIIKDNLNEILSSPVPINQKWGSAVSDDMTNNWVRGSESGATIEDGDFQDVISSGKRLTLSPNPVPTAPQSPLTSTKVHHWVQEWRVGHLSPGVGRRVQTNNLQRYIDHGRHLSIVSPNP